MVSPLPVSLTRTACSHLSATGPNPWKVAIVMEELNIPYESEFMDMTSVKSPEFEKINPNGRVPAIHDPNTGITLWESGAIIEYLVDTYDKNSTLSYANSPEKYHIKQWLHFQMSGQGPYFGQAAWFAMFHPEKIPSAIQRYKDQVVRVLMVLDKALAGKQYLVGDKATVADLSFLPWDVMVPWFFGDEYASLDIEKKYPNYSAWRARLLARPAVQKVFAAKQEIMAKSSH